MIFLNQALKVLDIINGSDGIVMYLVLVKDSTRISCPSKRTIGNRSVEFAVKGPSHNMSKDPLIWWY
jgi:hypothetical protein